MKYSIHQTNETGYSCIIGIANDTTKYLKIIKKKIKSLDNLISYEYVSEDDSNIQNKCGYFLIHYKDHKIELVEQYNQTTPGFIYNTILFNKRILFTWMLIINEYTNNDNIINNTLESINNHKHTSISYSDNNNDIDIDINSDNIDKESSKFTIDNIRKFNMDKMTINPNIAIIAKRRSGKSILILDMINNLHNKYIYKKILIISPTDKLVNFYNDKLLSKKEYVDKVQIIYELDYTIIEEMIHVQYKLLKQDKNIINTDNNVLIILDDCLASKGDWMKNKIMMELFYNSRHYGITLITCMQFPMGISPEIRLNFDYVFMFAENFVSNKKRLYDHYVNMIPKFITFVDIFDELTKNYGCFIVSNTGKCEIINKIFHYIATLTK
jgi:hypothetical protein